MRKRFGVLTLFAVISMFGIAAHAAAPSQCATWHRRYYDSNKKAWVYTDHNTSDPADQSVDLRKNPVDGSNTGVNEVITIRNGDSDGHGDPRYGVIFYDPTTGNTKRADAWTEALGGGGYGSHGYPYYPFTHTGEGGVVQGDIHPYEVSGAPDVNYSVWSFSADDEGDTGNLHNTVTGACVSANGTTVNVGRPPEPTPAPSCSTSANASGAGCYVAPHGHCDSTGTMCDEGIVVPAPPVGAAIDQVPVHMSPPQSGSLKTKELPPNR